MSAAPLRVATIDLDDPLTDLDCVRCGSPPYTGVWLLVCRSGRPLGSIQVPLSGTRLPAEQIEHEIRRQIVDRAGSHANGGAPLSTAVTVVVATTYSRPELLERSVASFLRLDYPNFDVIVVDNRARTSPPVELDGVQVLHEPRPGGSAARNRGLAAATGEIVAFTDDDVEVDPHWLSAIVGRFARQPRAAVVTGLIVPRGLETQAQVLFEQSGSHPARTYGELTFERAGRFRVRRRGESPADSQVQSLYATGEFGNGSNMSFRTSVLREIGGFDEALGPGTAAPAGEELAVFIELLAAGHQLAYEPTAIVRHTHRTTLAELRHQIHSYGKGFIATLTALAVRNPWHLVGLVAVVPAWFRSLRDPASPKRAHRSQDYPRELERAELTGMLLGPFAYAYSRWTKRRWRDA